MVHDNENKGDEMKRIIAICGLCFTMLGGCNDKSENSIDIDKIESVTIEVISPDDNRINATCISEDDMIYIKELLSTEAQNEDKGFVFAEGMYRVILKYDEGMTYLYPYCGNASTIRVGDSGATYIKLDSEKQETFENVIEKYIDIKGGIWEWEEYEDN